MDSIRLYLKDNYESYFFDNASIKMLILGCFFSSDVGCRTTFRDWVLVAEDGDYCNGNITGLEIEGDEIIMTDLYPEIPVELRIKKSQFIKLFDEWREKVCKTRPKEVMIIYDNDGFRIEVKE